MSSSVHIIERVKDQREAFEPFDVELRVLDVCVDGFDLDIWIEFPRGLFRNLTTVDDSVSFAKGGAARDDVR